MVKIFFHLGPDSRVTDTDGSPQVSGQQLFDHSGIPSRKSRAEPLKLPGICPGLIFKPLLDLSDEQVPDLPIRDYEFVFPPGAFSPLRQIAGGEQYTPQIVYRLIQFAVRQPLIDRFTILFPAIKRSISLFVCRPAFAM